MCHIWNISNVFCFVFPIEYITIFFNFLSLQSYIVNRKK
nr:MAG TPA: hypothetical protein [Caudoviricetes sp.]DAT70411.1 MAG TPA: hypothetical protein [Caudoviricetes sp.]